MEKKYSENLNLISNLNLTNSETEIIEFILNKESALNNNSEALLERKKKIIKLSIKYKKMKLSDKEIIGFIKSFKEFDDNFLENLIYCIENYKVGNEKKHREEKQKNWLSYIISYLNF